MKASLLFLIDLHVPVMVFSNPWDLALPSAGRPASSASNLNGLHLNSRYLKFGWIKISWLKGNYCCSHFMKLNP